MATGGGSLHGSRGGATWRQQHNTLAVGNRLLLPCLCVGEKKEAAAGCCRVGGKRGWHFCGVVQQAGGGTAAHWRHKRRREKEGGEERKKEEKEEGE